MDLGFDVKAMVISKAEELTCFCGFEDVGLCGCEGGQRAYYCLKRNCSVSL